jgi:carbon-monoxide dehydrogenase medium subunit
VKLRQQASGFAIAGAATVVALDESGRVSHARVAITGVNGVPYRALAVEANLLGNAPTVEAMAAAATHAADGIEPLSDIHGSAEYRRDMACVITRRALLKSLERIGG